MTEFTGPPVTLDGSPVEGARVTLIGTDTGAYLTATTTDANGDWAIDVDVGENTTVHSKAEYDDGGHVHRTYNQPFVPALASVPPGSSAFELNYDGPGIDFTSLTQPGWETQGVCYSDDNDQWYVSEVTDSSTPSTIHEFNEDGTTTGATFQFSSASPNPNHANSLQWHDGHLWCSEFNTNTVYKIDWSAGSVVNSFALGNGVVDSDSLGAIAFIPTTTGGHKLLAAMWGSNNSAAYLINYDDALTDGTASGNVYRTLTDDVDTGRVQGLTYYEGVLYVNSDALPNTDSPNDGTGSFKGWGSYPTYKIGFPYADDLSDNDPFLAGRYVWCWLNANIPYDDPIQDIGYNPNTSVFFTASEGTSTVYSGTETTDVGTLPSTWSLWNTEDIGSPTGEWTRSLVMDNSVSPGKHDQHIFHQRQPADVEVWVYDDLADVGTSDDKRAYVSVAEPENAHNDTENALAINSLQSETDYVAWNSTDGWHSTGISRPGAEQWVKFRWEMDGSQTDTFISTDGGDTWQSAGTYTYSATALGVLIPQVSTGVASHIGPFTVTPQ